MDCAIAIFRQTDCLWMLRALPRSGCIKLSELQESTKARVLNPLIATSMLDFSKVEGVEAVTVGRVEQAEAVVAFGSDLHTLAKCPFFWQFRQTACLAGHLWRGC